MHLFYVSSLSIIKINVDDAFLTQVNWGSDSKKLFV